MLLLALERPRERERDRARIVEERALDLEAEIDPRRIIGHRALARHDPDFGDGARLERDKAVLVEVLRLPVASANKETRARRGRGERHDGVAAESVLAVETELSAFASLGPAPEIPVGVVLGGPVVVQNEQRLGFGAVDAEFVGLDRAREAGEVVGVRKRGGACRKQCGQEGENTAKLRHAASVHVGLRASSVTLQACPM